MKNKGIGLPVVLGIITVLFIIIGSVLLLVLNSALLVERNIELTEEQNLGMNKVQTAGEILIKEQNFDQTYILELESFLDVSIINISGSLWKITYEISGNRNIVSYLSASSVGESAYDKLLQFTGSEDDFFLSPDVNAKNFLDSYLSEYFDVTFPLLNYPQSFQDFDSIVDYIFSLTQTGEYILKSPNDLTGQSNPTSGFYWFIQGDVNMPSNKDLTVPDGQILFIDGDLTMNVNSTLRGNVVVNGAFTTVGQGNSVETVAGTVYVRDSFEAEKKLHLGEEMRPGFILAQGDITLLTQTSGLGYILGNIINISGQGNLNVTGGIYVVNSEDIPNNRVFPNPNFDESLLFDFALPSGNATGGGQVGGLILTLPRLEN